MGVLWAVCMKQLPGIPAALARGDGEVGVAGCENRLPQFFGRPLRNEKGDGPRKRGELAQTRRIN